MIVGGAFRAGKFGVRGDCREAMSWYVHLGKDIYKPVFGILYKLPYIVLCIEAAIVAGLIRRRRGEIAESADPADIPGAYLRKLREALDFDPPSFVIGKVQVQQVVFVFHHLVDKILYFRLGEEV